MTTRRAASLGLLSTAALAIAPGLGQAQSQAAIDLPAPRTDFGKSLAQALRTRRSTRVFAPRPLPLAVLSELL